jgi:hypothetical protein
MVQQHLVELGMVILFFKDIRTSFTKLLESTNSRECCDEQLFQGLAKEKRIGFPAFCVFVFRQLSQKPSYQETVGEIEEFNCCFASS